MAGPQRLHHHGEHLRPLGLQVQDHFGAGDGDRACSAGGRRLQQPLEFDQCRGEQLIFSLENRRSCRLILWAKIKKPVIGVITGFLWRRVRDSNPRDLSVYSISSAAPSTSRTTLRVYISIRFFFAQLSVKKFLERKAGENTKKYSIFDSESPYKQRVFRRTKRPSCRKISSQPRYDHFDNAPYDRVLHLAGRRHFTASGTAS